MLIKRNKSTCLNVSTVDTLSILYFIVTGIFWQELKSLRRFKQNIRAIRNGRTGERTNRKKRKASLLTLR